MQHCANYHEPDSVVGLLDVSVGTSPTKAVKMRHSLLAALLTTSLIFAVSFAQDNARPGKESQPAKDHHAMSPDEMAKEMRSMNEMMVKALGNAGPEYEKRFIDLMIPHHEGAVLMARDALKKASKNEIKDMAEKMIKEQEKEIATLKSYRDNWYTEKGSEKK